MREIILKPEIKDINFENLHQGEPVFAKKDGRLKGMVVKEDQGWILKIGASSGAYGHHDTLFECLERGASRYRYTFFIEEVS